MNTASMRRPGFTSIDHYPRDDDDPTIVGAAPGRLESSRHVATALRAIPDWSIGATVLAATYSSDVSSDGLWSALADSAGLDAADLTLEWEG